MPYRELQNKITDVAKASIMYVHPLAIGTVAGGVVPEVTEWQSPLAVAALASIAATLVLGLIDRLLRWLRDNRLSALEFAKMMAQERKDMNDRQEQMRLEQHSYYRELIAEILHRANTRTDERTVTAAEVNVLLNKQPDH